MRFTNHRIFPSGIAFFFAMVVFSALSKMYAQNPNDPSEQLTRNITSQGREFWIAVPQNDYSNPLVNALEIYVTSSQSTTVTVEHSISRFRLTKEVLPYTVTTFSTRDGGALWNWELTKSEQIESGAIHITAEHPVSVYILNAKERSADGYTALPVQAWGQEYMHCSYYDHFDETLSKEWGSGFTVIAADNGTEITINLRGKNFDGRGRTVAGRNIPFLEKIILNKGETYTVQGNGKTIATFDLTGSFISANKPIGLISYHQRAMIPSNNQNGRSYLVEMIPPIHAWGKKHAVLEFQREGKGDFFRILAAENDTKWTLKYYDKTTGKIIKQGQERVLQAGEFYEELNSYSGRGQAESIRGVSVWEANKPVLVMQYSYSTFWDNTNDYDPFMSVVPPVEQFISATVFETPTLPSFQTHWFNLIAVGDPKDNERTLLKSIQLDGQPVWQTYPSFLGNRIPETNLFWAQIKLEPGSHLIAGNTTFSGHVYGFGNFNSYGMPAAVALKRLNRVDTLPPLITKRDSCGNFHYRASELRTFPGDPLIVQKDQGIYSIELVQYLSTNYKMKYITAPSVPYNPTAWQFEFALEVIDPTKDAYGVVTVVDRAGNSISDTCIYPKPSLTVEPGIVDFGSIRSGKSSEINVTVKNNGKEPITISTIVLRKGIVFSLKGEASGKTLEPSDSIVLTVIFRTPSQISGQYNDEILIQLLCGEIRIPVKGSSVRPCISISELNVGKVILENELCTGIGTLPITISNFGTDTLYIYSIKVEGSSQFSLNLNPNVYPIRILPGNRYNLDLLCFKPKRLGQDSALIKIVSNTDTGCTDSAYIRGIGVKPGPFTQDIDFGTIRVKTTVQKSIELYNKGTASIVVQSVSLLSNGNGYVIKSTIPNMSSGNAVTLNPNEKLIANVEFSPQNEDIYNSSLIFRLGSNDSLESSIKGIGYLPDLVASGFAFPNEIPVLTQHPIQGNLTIERKNKFGETVIFTIKPPLAGEFTIIGLPPTSQIILTQENNKVVFPVQFVPNDKGIRKDIVIIESDCSAGPEPIVHRFDTVTFNGAAFEPNIGKPNISTVDTLDFGSISRCETATRYFSVNNPGGTANLIVKSLKVIDGDTNVFVPQIFTTDVTIAPNEPKQFYMVFTPDSVGEQYATVRVIDNIGSEKTILIKAYCHNVPVYFSSIDRERIEPGITINLPVIVKGKDLIKSNIKELDIELRGLTRQISFKENVRLNKTVVPSWTFTKQPAVIDKFDTTSISFSIKSSSSLASEGVIADIPASFFISENDIVPFSVRVNVVNDDNCADTDNNNNRIKLTSCFVGAPKLKVGSSLVLTIPEFSKDRTIDVHYSCDLSSPVTIELYNILGEKVKSCTLNSDNAGQNTISFDMAQNSHGLYFCKFTCGPYLLTSQTILQ